MCASAAVPFTTSRRAEALARVQAPALRVLAELAAEARAEHGAGRTLPLDPERV